MKAITTSCYTFSDLIEGGCVYVDKTAIIRKMIPREPVRFFLSRPRRFGKSLLVDTLKCIFEGRRELFKGLAIDLTDYDWVKYPVIHLDMTDVQEGTPETIRINLRKLMLKHGKNVQGFEPEDDDEPGILLEKLIEALAAQSQYGKVVVLVDEYDAPIGGLLGDIDALNKVRKILHDFYVKLKSHDAQIRFLFMTGVSKFTKLSVFSGLNHLTDISMNKEYATLLGYTPDELNTYFREHIQSFADAQGISFDVMVDELRGWYNGYRFSDESDETVLNPVSVGRALAEKKFRDYWGKTGYATIIVERIRKNGGLPADLSDLEVMPESLDVCDAERLPMEALLYQCGYVTIKDVLPTGCLRLGIPNKEIRGSLNSAYVREVYQATDEALLVGANSARYAFEQGDPASAFASLAALFAKIPAEWQFKTEAEVKRYFLMFFAVAGADIITEAQSALGRADVVLTTRDAIYVIEFKYGRSSKTALKQIKTKGYAEPYRASGKKIVLIGINYSAKKRALDKPVMEDL